MVMNSIFVNIKLQIISLIIFVCILQKPRYDYINDFQMDQDAMYSVRGPSFFRMDLWPMCYETNSYQKWFLSVTLSDYNSRVMGHLQNNFIEKNNSV